ncbi:erythrocyte membrane protein 1 (PfEMP1), truncated, putative [Plasmodium gaboni]|uniref:Erythrocyte membrane protein 1 (PfEMP1), truncated, putative n=1 Tax=Plasmodium gaboni TaxID=647221 RepID=A0ABY0KWJ1_9APIC|nr:erythrocyte membrane protein 1 (PfEMP1), truncated, putative [Plasmodium gaboni]
MTEWGEYICIEHKKELEKLTTACDKCKNKCDNSGCNKKYDEKQKQYKDDDENETYGLTPSMYLILNNGDVCSGSVFSKIFNDKAHGDQEQLCSCQRFHTTDTDTSSDTDNEAPNDMKNIICTKDTQFTLLCNKNYGVYAPPRRQKLCLENIWHYSKDVTTLENQLLQVAKSEGNWLKQYYSNNKFSKNGVPPNGLCKALERTYADYRDLILGKDMWNGLQEKELEKKLKTIFNNGQSNRESWWNDHKDNVWKALTCGNSCTTITPSDSTPQFLRWYEEWYEEFCKKRKELLNSIQTSCSGKKPKDNCDNDDKDCENACSKYSTWLLPKKFEWKNQKQNYETKNINHHKEGYEFYNVTKDKNKLPEYLKDKCQTSLCQCEKDKIDVMDLIFEKNDDEYKNHYEPLCSKCRKKQLIDKVNEKKKEQKKNPSTPASPIEDICKNGNNVCEKVNVNDPIKVPIDPDYKDSKNNRENNGINCGGIPSNKTNIKWVNKVHYNWLSNLDPNIYVSPRRRTLCSHGLDKLNSVSELKTQLLKVAANDAYNVGIKYNDYKNHYGVKPCKALQYSFNDYKHIIVGTDNLEPPENNTEKNMKKIFAAEYTEKPTAGQPGSTERKNWWNENKRCVWEIMKCGYKKGKDEANRNKSNAQSVPELNIPEGGATNNDCKIPTDTENSDQFLSWLTEWYDDYL